MARVFRSRKRLFLLVAILFLLAVAIVVFFAASRQPATATADDGRTITVEKVTFGTHHRFAVGKWWARLLKLVRGKRWAAQRGCYEVRLTNDTSALMVWTRWDSMNRSNTVAVEAAIVDEQGTESELVLNRWNAVPGSFGANSQPAYVAWLFNNFPRRSDSLRLRIYDRDQRQQPTQTVELAFSNPVGPRFAEWNGSALPVTATRTNTDFVLSAVQQLSNALWKLNFVVRTNGQLDPSWRVAGVVASSPSGNSFVTRSNLAIAGQASNSEMSPLTFHLRGALWSEEPAWRFTAEFCRATGFQPDELWILTNIAIPSRALPFQLDTNLASHPIHPLYLKLEGAPPAIPFVRAAVRRNANIYMHFEAAAHIFLAAATDDQGREVRTEVDRGAPPRVYSFGLAIQPDAYSVNLTFAIRRPTVVTFDVASSALGRLGID